MHISVDVYPRFIQRSARFGIINGHGINGAILITFADFVEGCKLRISRVERFQRRRDFIEPVIAVEPEWDCDFILGCRRD